MKRNDFWQFFLWQENQKYKLEIYKTNLANLRCFASHTKLSKFGLFSSISVNFYWALQLWSLRNYGWKQAILYFRQMYWLLVYVSKYFLIDHHYKFSDFLNFFISSKKTRLTLQGVFWVEEFSTVVCKLKAMHNILTKMHWLNFVLFKGWTREIKLIFTEKKSWQKVTRNSTAAKQYY